MIPDKINQESAPRKRRPWVWIAIALLCATLLYAVKGCQEQPQVGRIVSAVQYDVYCAKKHTLAEAQAVGLNQGCTSVGPPDKPLASVVLKDGTPYPGDDKEGYLCQACTAIEAATAKAAAADAGAAVAAAQQKLGLQPDPSKTALPFVGCRMSGGALWCVDADFNAWELVKGEMIGQAGAPSDWPTQ